MITCTITTSEPYSTVEKLLRSEITRQHARSQVTLAKERGKALVHINANDTVALRATFNGITSILSIHEKTHDIA